ncbi:MAG: MTAP family purine nucleoside phosphorylase [Candidatus Hodarchaeales archaeon]
MDMEKNSSSLVIGIIGGSGFYDFLKESKKLEIETPFGKVNVEKVEIDGTSVCFIPRHGTGHSVPPHMVNYKANIYAFHSLGASKILSTNAVGSMDPLIEPGSFVLLDQFIALYGTETFFDGQFETTTRLGNELRGVRHIDMTEPYCSAIRNSFIRVLDGKPYFFDKGTYVMCKGPRFETAAEIALFSKFGNLAGMTNAHECSLARELEICYGTLCVVTNYAAGMQDRVTHAEVVDLFGEKIGEIKEIFKLVLKDIIQSREQCSCHDG